jgi:hypothetical protein
MNAVDPMTGEIGERGQVFFGRQPARRKRDLTAACYSAFGLD